MTNNHHQQTHKKQHPVNAKLLTLTGIPGAISGAIVCAISGTIFCAIPGAISGAIFCAIVCAIVCAISGVISGAISAAM